MFKKAERCVGKDFWVQTLTQGWFYSWGNSPATAAAQLSPAPAGRRGKRQRLRESPGNDFIPCRAPVQAADETPGSEIIQRRYRNSIHDYSPWENAPPSPILPIFRAVEGTLSRESRFYVSLILYESFVATRVWKQTPEHGPFNYNQNVVMFYVLCCKAGPHCGVLALLESTSSKHSSWALP